MSTPVPRRKRSARGPRPGLDTTELSSVSNPRNAPPPDVAQRAGDHPAVASGAATAVIGVLLVIASAIVLIDAAQLRPTTEPLGPAAFPTIIGILLGLVGIALVLFNLRFVLTLIRNRSGKPNPQVAKVAVLLGSIVVYALILPFVGFTVTSAALFTVGALLLGSPHRWRLPLYGLVLGGIVTLLFDRIIGLSLPAGPWGF